MSGTIDIPFAIGETVWYAGTGNRPKRVVCPECAGKAAVTVHLGNGEQYEIECAGCRLGYDPATGYVTVDDYSIKPQQITLRRVVGLTPVSYSDSFEGDSVYHCYDACDLYRDKAECEARCAELAAERNKREHERFIHRGDSAKRSMAWSVHYWRSQLAHARKEVAMIEARLREIKDARP